MADVFISYSRLDHARVRPIAERLGSLGYSVWWEQSPRDGAEPGEDVSRALEQARAVLTVWSDNARNAGWVHAASLQAYDADKLLQMRIDEAVPPAPFSALEVADMSGSRAEWGPLEDRLQRLVRAGIAPAEIALAGPRAFAAPRAAGPLRWLSAISGLALLATAGAISAAMNELISPTQLQWISLAALLAAGGCALLGSWRWLAVRRAGG
mgnify:CR=1 FL=1